MDNSQRSILLERLRALPDELEAATADLSAEETTWRYRAGGWSIAQLVHHIADAHMHGFLRSKFILAEESPSLLPYDENRWAATMDGRASDIATSLMIVRGVHARWTDLLEQATEHELQRVGIHKDEGPLRLEDFLTKYARHGEHHVQQILQAREKQL